MNEKEPCVYILASGRNAKIYVGCTSCLKDRVREHRLGIKSIWASGNGATLLVHYEFYDSMDEAILRERALKKYRRKWKLDLIERTNPEWNDLYDQLYF